MTQRQPTNIEVVQFKTLNLKGSTVERGAVRYSLTLSFPDPFRRLPCPAPARPGPQGPLRGGAWGDGGAQGEEGAKD